MTGRDGLGFLAPGGFGPPDSTHHLYHWWHPIFHRTSPSFERHWQQISTDQNGSNMMRYDEDEASNLVAVRFCWDQCRIRTSSWAHFNPGLSRLSHWLEDSLSESFLSAEGLRVPGHGTFIMARCSQWHSQWHRIKAYPAMRIAQTAKNSRLCGDVRVLLNLVMLVNVS